LEGQFMTTYLIGGAIAAMVAVSTAFAQVQPAPPPGQPIPQAGQPAWQHGQRAPGYMMRTEDRAEVAAHVQKMFARLDANRDGFITKSEADAEQAQRSERFQQRQERRAQKMEKRGKGRDQAAMFDRIDANHDGKITQAEADAAQQAHEQAMGGKPAHAHAVAIGGLFARADTNKDGVVSRAEFDTLASQWHGRFERAGMHRGFAGRMFDTADTNKDGRVSLAEAQAVALQHFDRADLNHDGKLTPEERQQVRQQFRAERRPS
jgi:Ca2+-binding EF-hand superfamily protein